MERYRRVEKHKSHQTLDQNEIRITAQGLVRNYISYALPILQTRGLIVLKAMGQAISKAIAIAEIIKKRSSGVHQDIVISSPNITDVWEPVEEGLIQLEISRQVSLMSITLSTTELNKNSPGYQAHSLIMSTSIVRTNKRIPKTELSKTTQMKMCMRKARTDMAKPERLMGVGLDTMEGEYLVDREG